MIFDALIASAAICTALAGTVADAPSTGAPAAPATLRQDVHETMHGVEFIDSYRWLEDQNSPQTRDWIDAQNGYTRSLLENRPARKAIQARLAELMRVDHVQAPIERGGRYFLWKKKAEDDLPILYTRTSLDAADQVLLNPLLLSEDHTTSAILMDVAANGRTLVYGIRRGGGDEVEMRVMNVDRRADLPDSFPRALYDGVSLTPDGSGFYYTWRTRAAGARIRYHAVGTSPATDRELFGEGHGPGDWIGANVAEDGRHLVITVQHGWASSDVYIKDLQTDGAITPIVEGVGSLFEPWIADDVLFMKTDLDAPRGRVVAVDLAHPGRDKWKEIVAQGADAIQEISLAGGRLFVHYLHDVSSRVEVFAADGKRLEPLRLPGLGTAGAPAGSWRGHEAFYGFTSFTVPRTTYIYDTASGKSRPWARDVVPVDPERFEVRQVWYRSKDATRVPMFLIHRKGLALDGNRPTLLYGYGGFDVSLAPSFNPTAVWWAEQGGVYAVANIRGGGEFGEEWHRAGMLGAKQNVFDDFLAAAEWLVANRYTKPARLAIRGGSNGGLLVAAALTQRPDLFAAVLCEYPDLDMIRYPLFENNNPPALLEYGDARVADQFRFLSAYSPYQKVSKGVSYPAVLLTSGDQDTRVPPLQARKMTAALQWATTSGRPVALLYDTRSGHAGGKPFAKVVEDLSLEAAFLTWQLGMDSP
ncbi:MAG TPA: prolyl oligopeptidase family serine peptidase [Patescibacteria group bacterium]|nr:prolyl oligopeptidase family serine peptidase [Patescibacteria group bacterium]